MCTAKNDIFKTNWLVQIDNHANSRAKKADTCADRDTHRFSVW